MQSTLMQKISQMPIAYQSSVRHTWFLLKYALDIYTYFNDYTSASITNKEQQIKTQKRKIFFISFLWCLFIKYTVL